MRFSHCFLLFLSTLLVSACGDSPMDTEELVAKGGKKYGGEFRFMSPEKLNSLFPAYNYHLHSSRVFSQIYEPLISYNIALAKTEYAVAESIDESPDSKTFTIHIRKGILFHEDDCFNGGDRELNASDVKFTFDLACSGLHDNKISYLLKNIVSGAQSYFDSTQKSQKLDSKGVSGIRVIDDYTLEIQLNSPHNGFENILSNPYLGIVSKRSFDHYGKDIHKHPVGSGPFVLEKFESDEIRLTRNPEYWKKDEFGNQLPFLAHVVVTYAENKRSELMAFRKSDIDLVLTIPVEEIENILGTLKEAQEGKNVMHRMDAEMSLSMRSIGMNCESDVFKNKQVRKAFNLAIDRESLIENWLEGEGYAAGGFVPSMGESYDNSVINGHRFDPEKARSLLSEAGYESDFPELEIYTSAKEGTGNYLMCQGIVEQLNKNLGINLSVKPATREEVESAIRSGKALLWATSWIADYPDPENFLSIFYGKNMAHNTPQNLFKYTSAEFDKFFEDASSEKNAEVREKLLQQCDQILVDEAAVIPVLTHTHMVMINARIRNFEASPMEGLDLRSVFIKEIKTDDG